MGEIGGEKLPMSFTVLEDNKIDLLFGLDNLKRHQCSIDLVDFRLHRCKGDLSVPFLPDGEIKRNKFEDERLELKKQLSESNSPSPSQAKDEFGGFKKELVEELLSMGFTKGSVLEALKVCDGNKEHALNF